MRSSKGKKPYLPTNVPIGEIFKQGLLDPNKYHYLSPPHTGKDGIRHMDVYETDTIATKDRELARKLGIKKITDKDKVAHWPC